ncbi:MAG: phosphatidate cytidylyltransferase [bacterium]
MEQSNAIVEVARGKRDLLRGVLTPIFFAPIFLATVFYPGLIRFCIRAFGEGGVLSRLERVPDDFFFFILAGLALGIGLYEFYMMVEKKGVTPFKLLGFIAAYLIYVGVYWKIKFPDGLIASRMESFDTIAIAFTVVTGGSLFWQMFNRSHPYTISNVGTTVFGTVYVGGLLSFALLLINSPSGRAYLFLTFLAAWIGDASAFFVGGGLGKHKLIPRISPNKTVEGAVGGLLASVITMAAAGAWVIPSLTDRILLGTIISIVGQIGDLAESLIKRDAGVKDSGGIIPGHGGVLDKLDSLLFTMPIVYYYIKFAIRTP